MDRCGQLELGRPVRKSLRLLFYRQDPGSGCFFILSQYWGLNLEFCMCLASSFCMCSATELCPSLQVDFFFNGFH
jgi:hypothetical protein